MQRKTFLVSTVALAAAVFAGAASAQAVKLTLAHGTALDNPRHTAALKFAEVAKAKSGGRIEVTVAGAAQLGDDAAMVTALRTGALDMSANSQGAVANVVPEYAAFGMPFLFSSQAHAWKVMDGPAGKLHEVQKFISLTGHKYELTPFLIGKRSWDKLSDADKKIVQEAAAEATALQRKLAQESDEKMFAELKAKGVQIDKVDQTPFMAATAPVIAKWEASPIGPFVKKVVAAARAK